MVTVFDKYLFPFLVSLVFFFVLQLYKSKTKNRTPATEINFIA